MEEVWKDVVGYEGKYKVSNRGRVVNRRGREVKPEISQRGYLRVRLCNNNKKKITSYIELLLKPLYQIQIFFLR